jgi:hypothetical protein
MKNRTIAFTTIIPLVFVLACSALAPIARATPPPKPEDRGNGNSAAENVQALNPGTTGSNNTAHGWFSLFTNTTGFENTADGFQALYGNTTGFRNTAVGFNALMSNTTGSSNTANGHSALSSNTSGSHNTADGISALAVNSTGSDNTADGWDSLEVNTTGSNNTGVGTGALLNNSTGSSNIAVGYIAGLNIDTGDNNICIGSLGGPGDAGTTRIGQPFFQTRTFISGIRGVATGNDDAIPMVIDSAGQLGTVSSSQRFKVDIKPMDKTSDAILALEPVTFHYRNDSKSTRHFGLIAEQVAKVNPDLVVRDENGEIYTVRYDAVNAMLLNEFLKEHRTVEQQGRKILEQGNTIAQLRKDLRATVAELTTRLKEQELQIQKVSARLAAGRAFGGGVELAKATPQIVDIHQ